MTADAGATLPGVAATEHLVHALDACDVCSALHAAQVHGAESEIAELRAALVAAVTALREIRQWDMLNGYTGADGARHEPTADAPYWRDRIDRALAATGT